MKDFTKRKQILIFTLSILILLIFAIFFTFFRGSTVGQAIFSPDDPYQFGYYGSNSFPFDDSASAYFQFDNSQDIRYELRLIDYEQAGGPFWAEFEILYSIENGPFELLKGRTRVSEGEPTRISLLDDNVLVLRVNEELPNGVVGAFLLGMSAGTTCDGSGDCQSYDSDICISANEIPNFDDNICAPSCTDDDHCPNGWYCPIFSTGSADAESFCVPYNTKSCDPNTDPRCGIDCSLRENCIYQECADNPICDRAPDDNICAEIDTSGDFECGEFGTPCSEDDDCLSGLCIWQDVNDINKGKFCSRQCDSVCPSGFECQATEIYDVGETWGSVCVLPPGACLSGDTTSFDGICGGSDPCYWEPDGKVLETVNLCRSQSGTICNATYSSNIGLVRELVNSDLYGPATQYDVFCKHSITRGAISDFSTDLIKRPQTQPTYSWLECDARKDGLQGDGTFRFKQLTGGGEGIETDPHYLCLEYEDAERWLVCDPTAGGSEALRFAVDDGVVTDDYVFYLCTMDGWIEEPRGVLAHYPFDDTNPTNLAVEVIQGLNGHPHEMLQSEDGVVRSADFNKTIEYPYDSEGDGIIDGVYVPQEDNSYIRLDRGNHRPLPRQLPELLLNRPEFTVTFWLKLDYNFSNPERYIFSGANSSQNDVFSLRLSEEGDEEIELQLFLGDEFHSFNAQGINSEPIDDGEWHFISISVGEDLLFLTDAAMGGSRSLDHQPLFVDSLVLGQRLYSMDLMYGGGDLTAEESGIEQISADPFGYRPEETRTVADDLDGLLDELKFYNYEMTQQEIEDLYEEEKNDFLEPDEPEVTDCSEGVTFPHQFTISTSDPSHNFVSGCMNYIFTGDEFIDSTIFIYSLQENGQFLAEAQSGSQEGVLFDVQTANGPLYFKITSATRFIDQWTAIVTVSNEPFEQITCEFPGQYCTLHDSPINIAPAPTFVCLAAPPSGMKPTCVARECMQPYSALQHAPSCANDADCDAGEICSQAVGSVRRCMTQANLDLYIEHCVGLHEYCRSKDQLGYGLCEPDQGGCLNTDAQCSNNECISYPHKVSWCFDAGENCINGVDDDGDTLIDCADPDCFNTITVGPDGTELQCAEFEIHCEDNFDNDGDGLVDAADPDCPGIAAACGDGTVDEGEMCDDGNVLGGDSCSPSCEIENLCMQYVSPRTVGIGTQSVCSTILSEYKPALSFTPRISGGKCWATYSGVPIILVDGVLKGPISSSVHTTFELASASDVQACAILNSLRGQPGEYDQLKLCIDALSQHPSGTYRTIRDLYDPAQCPSTCGDGVVEGVEQCDDGNTEPGDGCGVTCQHGEICGNEVDDEGDGDIDCLDNECQNPSVIDICHITGALYVETSINSGVFDATEVACEDGVDNDNDGFVDSLDPDCPDAVCGDNKVEGNEECDFGDTEDGDGCSSSCQVEAGWMCTEDGCDEICGDTLIVGEEQCDTNDHLAGQTCQTQGFDQGDLVCSDICLLDTSGCSNIPIASLCVDPDLTYDPHQDSGALLDEASLRTKTSVTGSSIIGLESISDTCSEPNPNKVIEAFCMNETHFGWNAMDCPLGWTCVDGACVGEDPVCGNGVMEAGEVCDDGNIANGDGCSNICQCEEGWDCSSGDPLSVCGDGIKVGAEQCDPPTSQVGGAVSGWCTDATIGRSCSDSCLCAPLCGNGIVEAGEECDSGLAVDDDTCTPTCSIPEIDEICDNGIDDDGDGFTDCDDAACLEHEACQVETDCPYTNADIAATLGKTEAFVVGEIDAGRLQVFTEGPYIGCLKGDVDLDTDVDGGDLGHFVAEYQKDEVPSPANIFIDGTIDGGDLGRFVAGYQSYSLVENS